MKTLKFALITAIVACTMVSIASADEIKEKRHFKKVINVSLSKALTNPGLVKAMHEQLDKEDFLYNYLQTYVADVSYEGNIYRISGPRKQWLRFFTKFEELPFIIELCVPLN